jgi:prepilin signal peptidase PulO-like enzyme (type II secretory pathway)
MKRMSAFPNNVEQSQGWRRVRESSAHAWRRFQSFAQGAWREGRDRVLRFSEARFWISKWVVAAALFVAILLAGILLLVTSNVDFDTFLNYFALGLLIFVLITLFYGIIAIHDVPYEIAKHRNHPHQDAIHAAGWVSLFTLHAIWPFLWIWAMLYRPDRGWGMQNDAPSDQAAIASEPGALKELRTRVAEIERRLDQGVR